jgi:D-sedoheptulose 7-phosphate isomerase
MKQATAHAFTRPETRGGSLYARLKADATSDRDYFVRRRPVRPADFEQAYWGTVVDPDGNRRDRSAERHKHLADVAAELAAINDLPPGRILDVGCGLGFLLSGVADGWDKHGVEVSGYAAARAQTWGRIHHGDLESAAYPDDHFDVVVMHHVIEHMEDPGAALVEARRVLRCSGLLILGTPDFDSGCARRFGDGYRLLHDPTHISLFSNESMHRFLRDHDFEIESVDYPYFETGYFTAENLLKLLDPEGVSPPFYGNFMTFYCRKPAHTATRAALLALARAATTVAHTLDAASERAGALLAARLLAGAKVLVCGNGGSAADAQHFAAELVGRMCRERRPLPAIALSSDPSVVTALGNDYGYEQLFARQVEAHGTPGDVLVAISTSGRSRNILAALETARRLRMQTIALVGPGGDPALDDCDHCLRVPTSDTQHIQELHTALLHAMCARVEEAVVAGGRITAHTDASAIPSR